MQRKDLGLLALRVTVGSLMAGHGAQKLFGAFGGHGLKGTAGFMESMGLQPGKQWAALAGLSEFGGGVLTALGLFQPLGPLGMASAMTVAALTAHRDKPIWATEGGAELPVTNIAIALALALTGPGRYSLDKALGLRVPRRLAGLGGAAAAGGVYAAITQAQPASHDSKPDAEADEVEISQAAKELTPQAQTELQSEPEKREKVPA